MGISVGLPDKGRQGLLPERDCFQRGREGGREGGKEGGLTGSWAGFSQMASACKTPLAKKKWIEGVDSRR